MSVDFDIQQPVFSPDGEYLDDDVAICYREALMEGLAGSPEGQELVRQGGTLGWADTLMELGMGYLEVTPAAMTAEDLQEVLFEVFPRRVSAEPGCGQEIVTELRAFWKFLQREYGLSNAAACQRVLTTATARRWTGNAASGQFRPGQVVPDARLGLWLRHEYDGGRASLDGHVQRGPALVAPRSLDEVPRAGSNTTVG